MKAANSDALPQEAQEALASVSEFLEGASILLAGTLGLDGRPQVRPVCYLFARDGALYFLTGKSRRLYAELCRTPFVQLCARSPGADTVLRISGKVCFTEDEALLADCVRQRPELPALLGVPEEGLIGFFLLQAEAEWTRGLEELPETVLRLPDPTGLLIGITIRKKTELRDRISRILERREAEPPELPAETARLYDGALLLFAEAAKALWPRMDVQPIERAAVFETWDQREQAVKLAARLIGNAVIQSPEDLTYWLNPETLEALRQAKAGPGR